MNSAPSLWRSRGSRARTSRVPKMEGSTPLQSVAAASASMSSCAAESGRAVVFSNSPPLKQAISLNSSAE